MILLISPIARATRIAVIPTGGGEADKLAPLIERSLQEQKLEVVDHAVLSAVLTGEELNAAQVPDGTADRVKLGGLLNADLLVFVHTAANQHRAI